MQIIDCAVQQGQNYAAANVGRFNQLPQYHYNIPTDRGEFVVAGKVFLNQLLGLTGCEISLNHLESQASIPFLHRHQQHEEVYLVLQGQGEFQVDGEIFSIAQGSAVRVGTQGVRSLRNTGTAPLIWAAIQTVDGSYRLPEISDGVKVPGRVNWDNAEHRSQ